MMKLEKTLIATCIMATMAGCGGSSKTAPPPKVEPTPVTPPVETVITGKAIKGTVSNGQVNLYKYVDNVAVALTDKELKAGNIVTNDLGEYTFTLLDYNGPIKIEITPVESGNTTMTCDAPQGCGDISFGQEINLSAQDKDFVLTSFDNVTSGQAATVNVSALTHLAAILIQNTDTVTPEAIQEQSSIIANAFGINGDINELEPTNINDLSAVAAEDNADELRYGLMNSAIAQVIFADKTSTSDVLSSAFSDIGADLLENEGEFAFNPDQDDAFELSLNNVFTATVNITDAIKTQLSNDTTLGDTTALSQQLTQYQTQVTNTQLTLGLSADESGRITTDTEQVTTGDAIAKAKAMTNDIRVFANLFDVTHASNQEAVTQGDAYIALLDEAGTMVESEAESFLLISEITEAIAQLSIDYKSDTLTGTTFPIEDYLSAQDATGTIIFDEDNLQFSVNAQSATEKVALAISIAFSEDNLTATLTLNGSIESSSAALTIAGDSLATVTVDTPMTVAKLKDNTYVGEIVQAGLDLEVTLAQKTTTTITNPVTFVGKLQTTLHAVIAPTLTTHQNQTYDEANETYFDNDYYVKSFEKNYLPEVLNLSGEFSSLAGNQLKTALTVNIQDLNTYQAPEFMYLGSSVGDIVKLEISDDKNTTIETDLAIIGSNTSFTTVFTPGDQQGNWTAVYQEKENNVTNYTSTRTRTNTSNNGQLGSKTTFENPYRATVILITPLDSNGDVYKLEYFRGTSFNDNGDLIDDNGEIIALDSPDYQDESNNQTLAEFEQSYGVTPQHVTNAAELRAYQVSNSDFRTKTLKDGTLATIIHDDALIQSIKNGTATAYEGHASDDLKVEDKLKITITQDKNTVTTHFFDQKTNELSFTKNNAQSFTVVTNDWLSWGNRETTIAAVSDSTATLFTVRSMSIQSYGDGETYSFAKLANFKAIDENNDQVIDHYEVSVQSGESFDDQGNLLLEDSTLAPTVPLETFDTVEDAINSLPFYRIRFNPYTVTSALDVVNQMVSNNQAYNYEGQTSHSTSFMNNLSDVDVDDVGRVNGVFDASNLDALKANQDNLFPAIVTAPNQHDNLETKDVFLQGSVALSASLTLDDYQVAMQLSGQRTGLQDGKFTLDMSYKIPNDDALRRFSVIATSGLERTDRPVSYLMTNPEGVTLTLYQTQADEGQTQEQVIGVITVGGNQEKAAEIVDRNGTIVIVYSDETVESL